jgi:predicted phage terminase large subunit-like protein
MDALMLAVADELEGASSRGRDFAGPLDVARLVALETVQTPALDIIDAALIAAYNGTGPKRLIISMPPQEGKSQRVSRFFPTWLLTQNPALRIALIGYQDAISRRWGRQIRNDIMGHGKELGLVVRGDTSAANEWQLQGHEGGVITSSVAGSLTGRPVDVLIIDDPHKDAKEAGSEVMQENTREWWRTAASTRMPAGGGIVVVVQTRWHEADLAGFLMSDEDNGADEWHLINIPAQAVHDPGRGDDCKCGQAIGRTGVEMVCIGYDILGRKPGEYMVSARGRSEKDWEQRKRNAGTRGWASLYQGWPSPSDGDILKRGWWQTYTQPRWIERADGSFWALGTHQVVMSVDCAFKDTDGSDYVVLMVLARRGAEVWLLDLVRRKMDFEETCKALEELAAKWPQAALKIVEDKANGPAVIKTLRKTVGGIVPYTPKDSKEGRARAISPFVEAGNVSLPAPHLAPWVGAFIHECATFPNGSHDDQVDAFSQGMIRLCLDGGGGGDFLAEMEAEARMPAGDGGLDSTYWSTTHDDDDADRLDPVPAFAR